MDPARYVRAFPIRSFLHVADLRNQALMWLHDLYWMAALKPDRSAPLTKGSMTQIRQMLGAYKDARKKQLKGKWMFWNLGQITV